MAAGVYDTEIERGKTFSRVSIWYDESGTPINLTGYTVSGTVKLKTTDKVALASFTITVANQVSNTGQFTWSLTPTQTGGFPWPDNYDGGFTPLSLRYEIEAAISPNNYGILRGTLSEIVDV